MNPFESVCDEFYLFCSLNTELELPNSRDTVLHYFEQISKAFPRMSRFSCREQNEFVLEEEKELGSHRLMSLEPRKIFSATFNPNDMDDCHPQHEMMLDLAPPLLSVSPLDCESIDVMFGFDFNCKDNHDEVVAEVFGTDSKFNSLLSMPEGRVVFYGPTLTMALDETCKLQCRLKVVTRTNFYQIRSGNYGEEPISVYFYIHQYWGIGSEMSFVESYRKQYKIGMELVRSHVIPNVVVPLSEAISAR